jgi:hypothetical protein
MWLYDRVASRSGHVVFRKDLDQEPRRATDTPDPASQFVAKGILECEVADERRGR